MYQTFVLGLGILLVAGLAYFVQRSDANGVVSGTLAEQGTTTTTSVTLDMLPGVYLCNETSGCENPRVLTAYENGEAKLSASFENGIELLEEFGTWTIKEGGSMQILLTGTNSEVYGMPRAIFIDRLQADSLSRIRFDSKFYEDWKNPYFIKQSDL